jgi:hypothetical protein
MTQTGETSQAAGPRPLHRIADDIVRNWPRPNFAAAPYIRDMRHLGGMDTAIGYDDAEGIVLRFLGNARSWTGPEAKRVKAELRAMLAAHKTARH